MAVAALDLLAQMLHLIPAVLVVAHRFIAKQVEPGQQTKVLPEAILQVRRKVAVAAVVLVLLELTLQALVVPQELTAEQAFLHQSTAQQQLEAVAAVVQVMALATTAQEVLAVAVTVAQQPHQPIVAHQTQVAVAAVAAKQGIKATALPV